MDSNEKELKASPQFLGRSEGHGDLPRWWARFCKKINTLILAGLAKKQTHIIMESTIARWKCMEFPRMVEWGNYHAKWDVEKAK